MVTLDEDEVYQSNRLDMALILHVPPAVIDDMLEDDVYRLFAKYNANQRIQNDLMKRG